MLKDKLNKKLINNSRVVFDKLITTELANTFLVF